MWSSVSDVFAAFLDPMEGTVDHMYTDALGKVTIGIGNLIDSPAAALGLAGHGAVLYVGRNSDAEASTDLIVAEWDRIKRGRGPATLFLRPEGISSLLVSVAAEMEGSLRSTFSGWDGWPADAQLSVLSLVWAKGPGFSGWPGFTTACREEDWRTAATEENLSNSWMIRRNAINRGLMRNAAWWQGQQGYDSQTLVLEVPGSRPTVRLGDVDGDTDDIASMQRFLTWLGYPVSDTGTFDDATDAQVKAFQSAENALHNGGGFTPDGVVGQLTWAALGYLVPRL